MSHEMILYQNIHLTTLGYIFSSNMYVPAMFSGKFVTIATYDCTTPFCSARLGAGGWMQKPHTLAISAVYAFVTIFTGHNLSRLWFCTSVP